MLNRNVDGVDGTRCQLYQREFSDAGLTPSLVSSCSGDNCKDKDTYVQQKCTRSGARAQFQRAGGFRSTSFTVENRTTKDGAPVVDESGQPVTRNVYVRSAYVVPTEGETETGYRPVSITAPRATSCMNMWRSDLPNRPSVRTRFPFSARFRSFHIICLLVVCLLTRNGPTYDPAARVLLAEKRRGLHRCSARS